MFTVSFSSEMIGVETLLKYENGMDAAYVLGIFVMLLYAVAFYWNFRNKIYQKTWMPLILLISGICNHIIVLISRWGFHDVTYGMSSRYGLQYMEGLLGIILTAAFVIDNMSADFRAGGGNWIICLTMVAILGSSLVTTYDELHKVSYRMDASKQAKEVFFNHERYSDEELKRMFVVKDGRTCREAMELLKIYRLNIWKNLGSSLESSYKIYGVYEDNWLEKQSKIVIFLGKKEKITLGFYLPDGSLNEILGEKNIEIVINGQEYIRSPQEGMFDFVFEGIEDEVVDIEINAGFSIAADGEDLREKSMVIYSIQ